MLNNFYLWGSMICYSQFFEGVVKVPLKTFTKRLDELGVPYSWVTETYLELREHKLSDFAAMHLDEGGVTFPTLPSSPKSGWTEWCNVRVIGSADLVSVVYGGKPIYVNLETDDDLMKCDTSQTHSFMVKIKECDVSLGDQMLTIGWSKDFSYYQKFSMQPCTGMTVSALCPQAPYFYCHAIHSEGPSREGLSDECLNTIYDDLIMYWADQHTDDIKELG